MYKVETLISPPFDSVTITVFPKSSSLYEFNSIGLDESTTVMMDIKGLVDYANEIKKLEKQLGKTKGPMEQLETKMAAPGYGDNVSDEVKATNTERLDGMKKKSADIEEAIANFKNLMEIEKSS